MLCYNEDYYRPLPSSLILTGTTVAAAFVALTVNSRFTRFSDSASCVFTPWLLSKDTALKHTYRKVLKVLLLIK